jgi:hypothetical protein
LPCQRHNTRINSFLSIDFAAACKENNNFPRHFLWHVVASRSRLAVLCRRIKVLSMEFMYSFISEGMDKRPAYGFSQKLRAAVEKQYVTPSPLDYQGDTVKSRHQKGFSFGHRPRTNYVKDHDLPSPCEVSESDERVRGESA